MANPALLIADAVALASLALSQPAWGVYLNGRPVIQPATQVGLQLSALLGPIQSVAALLGVPNLLPCFASTIDFEYAQDFPISNYPQEQGAFQSYNKVTMPFDVKITLGCTGSPQNRQAFLSSCSAIATSMALFDVVTPETIYSGCNVEHISIPRREARRGVQLILVDLWFKEIPVAGSPTFTSTKQPGDAPPQSTGLVQPTSTIPSTSSNGSSYVSTFFPSGSVQ
jgi:hypothetical protein